MDWAKAKNILIFIFLLLNIALAFVVSGFFSGESVSEETLENTVYALKTRGVQVMCPIPRYHEKTGSLVFNKEGYDKKRIIKKLFGSSAELYSEGVDSRDFISADNKRISFEKNGTVLFQDADPDGTPDLADAQAAERYFTKIFADMGLNYSLLDVHTFNKEKDGALTIELREKYKGLSVFENYIHAVITKKGIQSLRFKYRKISGETVRGEIVPAYHVLLKNFKDKNDLKIISIEFGFKEPSLEEGTYGLRYVPVWRIIDSSGKKDYYAYTGEKLASDSK